MGSEHSIFMLSLNIIWIVLVYLLSRTWIVFGINMLLTCISSALVTVLIYISTYRIDINALLLGEEIYLVLGALIVTIPYILVYFCMLIIFNKYYKDINPLAPAVLYGSSVILFLDLGSY